MCTVLHYHPPHFCRFHTGIYPSSPPDLLPLCNSLPLSCLYSPEVPSLSILPSTLLVSSPTPAQLLNVKVKYECHGASSYSDTSSNNLVTYVTAQLRT